MVCNTRNNDAQFSPSHPSMADATLEVTSQQQNPQVTATVGVSHTETLGATMPTHVSLTTHAEASTVAARGIFLGYSERSKT